MTSLRRNVGRLTLVVAAGLLVLPIGAGGCEKKVERKQQQAHTPPPPPPLAPLEDLPMDPRVQFPQSREPSSRELAEGIAQLASSIVSGDEVGLAEVLDDQGNMVLDALVDAGLWSREAERIEAVRVCVLKEEQEGRCRLGLGIQDAQGAYLLAWGGERRGDAWIFSPEPLMPIEGEQLAMLDDAPLAPPSLPAPVRLDIDPESMKIRPIERFSK